MTEEKTNLIGLTCEELSTFAASLGEPAYRGNQIFEWIYARGATSFHDMTNLSRAFREKLESNARVKGITTVAEQRSSRDGTVKFLFALEDGLKVETVLIPPLSAFRGREAAEEEEQRRLTICLSTQVGCPLDCAFCATASMGYLRNLTAGEIAGQILEARRITGRRITNVVFMGMGEPLLNYENVMKAVEITVGGMGIAARRITISTAGWADGIRRMGMEQRKAKLAVSLHSALDVTRAALMPVTRRYSVEQLVSSVGYYYGQTKQRVTYEYILFDGVNDTEKEVAALIKVARLVPCKINVIPFHSISFIHPEGLASQLRPSQRMEEIVERLRSDQLTVFVRSNAGEDIDAACGQLAVKTDGRKKRGGSHTSLTTPLHATSTP